MQISKKFKLAMVLSLALFASTVQSAPVSERCIIVVAQSAMDFTELDAYRNGFDEGTVPAPAQQAFMDAEIEAMQQMYGLGAEVLSRGGTREQALKFIRDSNANVNDSAQSDLPKELQEKGAKAAENAFMCGYDDQTNSL